MSYRERLQQRLDETGVPLRVGLVGAGQMGKGLAAQLLRMPGISLSAVLDVDRDRAVEALGQSGIKASEATDVDTAARAIESGGSVALAGIEPVPVQYPSPSGHCDPTSGSFFGCVVNTIASAPRVACQAWCCSANMPKR